MDKPRPSQDGCWFSGRAVTIPLALLADGRLKGRSKLVLAAIASFAGPDGRTPAISKSEIAATAGIVATNLARELRELERSGWLKIEHRPGAHSRYRLTFPAALAPVLAQQKGACTTLALPKPQASDFSAPSCVMRRPLTRGERLADAPVFSRQAVVIAVAAAGRGSVVTFALEDGTPIATIFPDDVQPCQIGDRAQLQVRQWRRRWCIAGGSASGVRWIERHPGPRLPIAPAFEFLVSGFDRYATPSGQVFVSFIGEHDALRAVASVPEKCVPRGLTNGRRIRVSRRDGAWLHPSPGCPLPQLDIYSDQFRIELL